jgi:uncharacterized protein (TIGR03067 family)
MFVSALFCAGLLLAQDASVDEKNQQELEKLSGEWVVHYSEHNGAKVTSRGLPITYAVKGSEYTMSLPMGKTRKVPFKIDASKEPKHFDKTESGAFQVGIYKLEGDTLTICSTTDGERPTEFKTTDKAGSLRVLKRTEKNSK